MEPGHFAERQQKLHDALKLMENALQLLDEAGCSADIGAHLDLAICRLRDVLPQSSAEIPPPTAETSAERFPK